MLRGDLETGNEIDLHEANRNRSVTLHCAYRELRSQTPAPHHRGERVADFPVDETFELNGFQLPNSAAVTHNLRRTRSWPCLR